MDRHFDPNSPCNHLICGILQNQRYIFLGACIAASALWGFGAFLWARYFLTVPDTDEAEAWILQKKPCLEPISFEAVSSRAKTDHHKIIFSRSLFPLISRLMMTPTAQENAIHELESYVSCINALSNFKLRKTSIWENKAAVTLPEHWEELQELRDLIDAIDEHSKNAPLSESGSLSLDFARRRRMPWEN
jgi:hypothetical protein